MWAQSLHIACWMKSKLLVCCTGPFITQPLPTLQHHSLNQSCSYFTSLACTRCSLCHLRGAKISLILNLQTQMPSLPWDLQAELGPSWEICFKDVFLLTEFELSLKPKCRGLKVKFGKNVNTEEYLNPCLMLIGLESSGGLMYLYFILCLAEQGFA